MSTLQQTTRRYIPDGRTLHVFTIYIFFHMLGWLLTGFWIGWLDLSAPYSHNSGLQAVTALSLFYTLYSSPLHTHYGSQSSLVVSWQRIYNNLTVISNHTWSLLSCHFLSSTFNSHPQNSTQFSTTQLFFTCTLSTSDNRLLPWNFPLYSLGVDPTENTIFYYPILFWCVYWSVA
jgi:hypothetical protein